MAGLLVEGPNPDLFRLLYEPAYKSDLENYLPYLLQIDAAHIVMLTDEGILKKDTSKGLLKEVVALIELGGSAAELFDTSELHRGLYYNYENYFKDKLGEQYGGLSHVARSRNDINATVLKLRLRDRYFKFIGSSYRLLSSLDSLAEDCKNAPMSGFSHYQPAQPTTLAHYIGAIKSELLCDLDVLDCIYTQLNTCPMGACAGFGTPFSINPDRVASLLGFNESVMNSLSAVAARGYVNRLLSSLSCWGVTVSRVAHDFQSWCSEPYNFLRLPDSLVSTSSIMPQKRNAYVFENIRGKCIKAVSICNQSLIGQKGVPFANSIESGTEAVSQATLAFDNSMLANELFCLMVENLSINPDQMLHTLLEGRGNATGLCDYLVDKYGISFREAHSMVGSAIRETPVIEINQIEILRLHINEIIIDRELGAPLSSKETIFACDVKNQLSNNKYGGGASPNEVDRQFKKMSDQLSALEERNTLRESQANDSIRMLREAISGIIEN